jgi:type IV secretory pathway protease TraF
MSPQADAMRTSPKVEAAIQFRLLVVALIGCWVGCNNASDRSRDAVVSGNSMAPAFWGQHVQANCDQCGYSFQVGDQSDKLPRHLVCPNCGDRSVELAAVIPRPAQRVRVIPFEASRRSGELPAVKRWDVVAVRASEARPAMIKRVVGLPNESIEFVDGDVFANGVLVRKSLEVAASMRVPVFDSQFDSADVLRRFRPQGDAKNWAVDQGEWKYSPSSSSEPSKGTQWLAYEQWRCVSSLLSRDHVVRLEDWYAANANLNRNLNETRDVWARIEFRTEDECRVDLAVEIGPKVYGYQIGFGQGQVSFGGKGVSVDASDLTALGLTSQKNQPFWIDVCTFDRRLTVMLNGQKVNSIDLPLEDQEVQSLSMIRIGGRDKPIVVKRFQLWRDIYYFGNRVHRVAGHDSHLIAGSNEYLLVGDNVPVSIDSRHWPNPAISGDEILGLVE